MIAAEHGRAGANAERRFGRLQCRASIAIAVRQVVFGLSKVGQKKVPGMLRNPGLSGRGTTSSNPSPSSGESSELGVALTRVATSKDVFTGES
jgi:hypothetical protein